MLLRLYVNMCVSIWEICICYIAMSIAFNSALSIFWYRGNLSKIWVLLFGLYTPDPAMCPSTRPSGLMDGGMNDPSVYMHCCGRNLSG